MSQQIDRRRHPRFSVSPSYTPVRLRLMTEDSFARPGHAYDISEAGIRFEMDIPVEPGTPVAMEIMLPEQPGMLHTNDGPGRAVFVLGNVVWCDVEEPGPAQMALAVTRYARSGDKERLMRRLTTGVYARVA
ncbi:MAG: PilZ domain-containing protein [Phycisphaeraceae bacterium]|nr:MAG: PilZ domain-containing protein [Phycisphaeraceae bacterium]